MIEVRIKSLGTQGMRHEETQLEKERFTGASPHKEHLRPSDPVSFDLHCWSLA